MQNSKTKCEEKQHRGYHLFQGITESNSEEMIFMLDFERMERTKSRRARGRIFPAEEKVGGRAEARKRLARLRNWKTRMGKSSRNVVQNEHLFKRPDQSNKANNRAVSNRHETQITLRLPCSVTELEFNVCVYGTDFNKVSCLLLIDTELFSN